jgi:hypothetical protein
VALENNRLDTTELLTYISAGERGPVTAAAQDLQLDPGLLWTLAQNALKPALRAWCRQLTPLAQGASWNRGTCFVCGGTATLAELQDTTRRSTFAADHAAQTGRTGCGAYCGMKIHDLRYCLMNGTRKTRIEVCDQYRAISKSSPLSRSSRYARH